MTNILTLEPLPARHGDCLLLHYGPAAKPGTIVIDGGPSQVYDTLGRRLASLARKRPGNGFAINLMMVSHIDDDHIHGVIDFTEAWRDAKADDRPWPWPVKALWHNSFERIVGDKFGGLEASIRASVASVGPDALTHGGHEDREALMVLASVGQGAQLRSHASLLKIPLNPGFKDLVVPPVDHRPALLGALELHVVGPMQAQVDALRDKFARELPKGGEAALAAYTDTSVANLSSIVVLARLGGRSILLTGDARGDYILDGLRDQGLLDATGKLHVDILKMPHHGSDRNAEIGFFEAVTADTYVVSADGTYENPDRATLEMLAQARPRSDRYTIHLTYEIAAIDDKRRAEHDKETAKGRKPAWDAKVHSLAAFFDDHRARGYAFKVSTPSTRASNCIDLLAPVTY